MTITKELKAIDRALLYKDILIISDVHIGYEESMNTQGILVPRVQFKEIIEGLEKIFSECKKVSKVIINGDLKHEFGTISDTEWRHTLKLLDFLSEKSEEVILIKGNHDTIIGPIAKKRKVSIKDYEIIDDLLFIHGDDEQKALEAVQKNKVKTVIIGHEHPAISLKEGPRTEKFKCFLKGQWNKYKLIVMPSFTPILEGHDITKEQPISPLIKDLRTFEVFVIGDDVYSFGLLKDL